MTAAWPRCSLTRDPERRRSAALTRVAELARALPLAFLAPDIIRNILDGRQPAELTVTTLKRLDPLPMRWDDQRMVIGMPSAA